jgi:hypothetical protein
MAATNDVIGDIRDIKPPVSFVTDYSLLIITAVIIAVIGIVLLSVFLYKRFKKALPPAVPVKTAHEAALEALEALRAKRLPSLGKAKEYYSGLSDIVRYYVEQRFSIRAPEMTTEEFFEQLRDKDLFSGRHKNLLKEFLGLCDIVKFARYGPTETEVDESYGVAKRFIDETKHEERKGQAT